MPESLAEIFLALHGRTPRIFHAPGRVNIIGEHTDYNDGFVLPAAIDKEVRVAAAARSDRRIEVTSLGAKAKAEMDLDDGAPRPRGDWSDYIRGVAFILESEGYRLKGASLVVASSIPEGAGLSSSAALEVSSGLAFLSLADIELAPRKLADICRRAENEFVGTRCGIMDQMAACLGRRGRAMLIDCRSLDMDSIPLDESRVSLVVVNTMVKHKLGEQEYNQRRTECEEGARILGRFLPRVRALRDVTSEQFAKFKEKLPEKTRARCGHVILENERTQAAAASLKTGDLASVGRLMAESHRSLRDAYQVSCVELDLLVNLARNMEGVFGARMTGGGFGGCTINLVAPESVDTFSERIADGYRKVTGIIPEVYQCRTADGAAELIAESAM